MNQIRVCTKRINTRNFILQNTIRLYTNFGLGGGNGPFGPHWESHTVNYYQLSTIEISTVRPSMRGIPYLMDFLDLGNLAHLRLWPKNLRA